MADIVQRLDQDALLFVSLCSPFTHYYRTTTVESVLLYGNECCRPPVSGQVLHQNVACSGQHQQQNTLPWGRHQELPVKKLVLSVGTNTWASVTRTSHTNMWMYLKKTQERIAPKSWVDVWKTGKTGTDDARLVWGQLCFFCICLSDQFHFSGLDWYAFSD